MPSGPYPQYRGDMGDKEAVAQARQRLQAALSAPKVVKKQKDFEFVIDNRNTYTLLNDFKSPKHVTKWPHGRRAVRNWTKVDSNCKTCATGMPPATTRNVKR